MKKNLKLFWGSSYDRGLDILLSMWPEIKVFFPKATLDICYGWDLFDKAMTNNKERQMWKSKVVEMMKQDGITHYGRVGKDKLKEIRNKCGVWAYPTYFVEINCITALEACRSGLVPVTMNLGALSETASCGLLINGNIHKDKVREEFMLNLLSVMQNDEKFKTMSKKCREFAKDYDWKNIANKWVDVFNKKKDFSDKKVSIYTPTIRDGFWNIMAQNLSMQEHKNFEWIIIDGQKKSRRKIADKYAKKYDLDIKYIHQGKTKRTYGLSQANNLAIEKASGELFVFLQDFILITPTALEELLSVSDKHQGDFIAPVDIYFEPKIKPNTKNKEDWFDGNIDVVGKVIRKNIRIKNEGIREAKKITDFEQNFGAVPTATLRDLGGYWEFFDEALGFDDTEIIHRGKLKGYKLWIDDTNQCLCIDHFGTLGKDRR